MLKRFVLFALVFVSMGAMAQDVSKIAYFNSGEVIANMPEYIQMQDSLQKEDAAIKAELRGMEEEYGKKYTAFMEEGDALIESIKVRRLQEIRDIEERAATFSQESQQLLQQLQQNLFIPIQQKVRMALEEVGTENGFAYILDAASLLFVNPSSTDATPLVKAKLGLK